MKILVLAVGMSRKDAIARSIAEYESRIGHYFDYEAIELRPEKAKGGSGARARAIREESRRLLAAVPEGYETVAVDERGEAWASEDFARYLGELAVLGRTGAAFLIGGAYGHSDELRSSADRSLSLSALTLPHELARLVLVEQIYRAGTILRGEPYHKGR